MFLKKFLEWRNHRKELKQKRDETIQQQFAIFSRLRDLRHNDQYDDEYNKTLEMMKENLIKYYSIDDELHRR